MTQASAAAAQSLSFTPQKLTEVAVGSRWRSVGRTLTESELMTACMLSTDWHPIHADAEYAATSPVGQRTFHGGYGIMLALGYSTHFPDIGDRAAVALGVSDWKFKTPLFVGDTVHTEVEISEMRRTSDGRRMVVQKTVQLVKSDGAVTHEGTTGSLVMLGTEHGDTIDTTAIV